MASKTEFLLDICQITKFIHKDWNELKSFVRYDGFRWPINMLDIDIEHHGYILDYDCLETK